MTVPEILPMHDLSLISKWASKWKILFNPDLTKPAQEVIFSRKNMTLAHPNIFFHDIPVERASHQEHFGIYLDEKLNLKIRNETALCKVNKGIPIIRKLRHALPTKSLLTICETPY